MLQETRHDLFGAQELKQHKSKGQESLDSKNHSKMSFGCVIFWAATRIIYLMGKVPESNLYTIGPSRITQAIPQERSGATEVEFAMPIHALRIF